MKRFLLIGAAIAIAGVAATTAFAADHRGGKRTAAAPKAVMNSTAPAKMSFATHKKRAQARHHRKGHRHHPVNHRFVHHR
jgi:hypothetical protein